ncbi:MAG: hypothetical protein CR975_00915 [Gammaproteobacteria bacterium]|nr:MAG: hypothetical protein CR975_00915 [Gammaproteobacteria bacterium]
MSDSLPLAIDPWLLYRHNKALTGTLLLSRMPNLQASQNGAQGTASVTVAVKQREDGHIVLVGDAEIELALECQRCLQTLIKTIKAEFELLLVKYEQQLSSVNDADDAIVCKDNLELAPLIEQELILSLPMIAKHDDCQAMYKNGADGDADRQHPFANLKDLLN